MPKTSNAIGRRRARRRLDERGAELRQRLAQFSAPHGGWVGAIREALGMSRKDLAARMKVTESTVARLEASERAGTAQLDTLRRTADALGCDLVYALVPRRPLEDMVQEQARTQAVKLLAAVQHTMMLEDQLPQQSALRQMLDDAAAERVDRPGLWNE